MLRGTGRDHGYAGVRRAPGNFTFTFTTKPVQCGPEPKGQAARGTVALQCRRGEPGQNPQKGQKKGQEIVHDGGGRQRTQAQAPGKSHGTNPEVMQ